MRISLKKCLAVVSSVALFAFLGFGYGTIAGAEEQSARVVAIVICYGAPQQGADVALGDRSETTKKNGACIFDVKAGSYTVSAQTKGSEVAHGGHAGPGWPAANKSVNLDLKPGEIRFVTIEVCQPEKWPQIFPYGGPSDVQK
ncbi:MAG: hypothetical protein HYW14_02245 [Planctomycetes bacterium]|nr:hypothetical protein [Planctomycetota bacterium]